MKPTLSIPDDDLASTPKPPRALSRRGYQVTDADGRVQFQTIYPGWYRGRTIHIHYRIRAFSGGAQTYEFTSQLFCDDSATNVVVAKSPYDSRGTRDTTNSNDNIYE